MKILIDGVIFRIYPYGGIARFFHEILTKIAERNEDVSIYILCEERYVSLLPMHKRIRPLFFHAWSFLPFRLLVRINSWRKKQFDHQLEEFDPDIFHSTYYTFSPCKNVKTVATVYDLIDYEFPVFMQNGTEFLKRQSKVLSMADHVISISKSTTKLAVSAFNLDINRVSTIHLDASTAFQTVSLEVKEQFRRRYTHGLPFFLFVGETHSYKNLATLIRAFGLIKESSNHFLLIAGHSTKGVGSLFIDIAIKYQVEDRIVRLIHPDDSTLCEAYNAAEVFVYPSLQEGFGIPLVEAMRCGTPIIASDIPVFREICGDGALYFNPHIATELVKCLTTVLKPEIQKELFESGKERAKLFSWDEAAKEIENIYYKLATSVDAN